jgi:hypothetical protein
LSGDFRNPEPVNLAEKIKSDSSRLCEKTTK